MARKEVLQLSEEFMRGCSEWIRLISFWLLVGVTAIPLVAEQRGGAAKPAQLKVIEIKETDGQILSYRHVTGSTEVRMRGTSLAREARIKLKVGIRPGFAEIDINRGGISGLAPAQRFGKDFLTYVLWAVSVDGKASNLGEITFEREQPVSINVTTPYQTFWLMVTAEPDYAVVDPSPQVVLYSVNQNAINEPAEKKALAVGRNLFFFTHYTGYDSAPGAVERAPNELLQARKAVELASQSGILAVERPVAAPGAKEEEHTRETLKQAQAFLAQAEKAYGKSPTGSDVVQFARTAAQIAENARALALGAVGGVLIHQLENEVADLRGELSKARAELSNVRAAMSKAQAKQPAVETKAEKPPVETKAEKPLVRAVSNPTVWFGVIGWALALLLLLRRQPT